MLLFIEASSEIRRNIKASKYVRMYKDYIIGSEITTVLKIALNYVTCATTLLTLHSRKRKNMEESCLLIALMLTKQLTFKSAVITYKI